MVTGREIGFRGGGTAHGRGEPSGVIYMGRRGYSLIGLWRRRRGGGSGGGLEDLREERKGAGAKRSRLPCQRARHAPDRAQ